MAKTGREAKTQRGQFDIFVDLSIGDEVCFERESGDNVCKAMVVSDPDATSSIDHYGESVPKYVYLEGPRGGKYVAIAGGLEANEEHVQLYNTPGGHYQSPDPWDDDSTLLSFDVMRVTG